MKASAVAAKQRRAQDYVKETEASRQKYDDKGGSPSYPRGDQHKSKQQRSRPRISKATAKKIGDARGETHDANTEFEARDHESLQKRARRRGQGQGQHGHRPNPTRGREDTPRRVSSALSPTPRWEVTHFLPGGIAVPADGTTGTLMVHGMVEVPIHRAVHFIQNPPPFVYTISDAPHAPVEAPREDAPDAHADTEGSTSVTLADPTDDEPSAHADAEGSLAEPSTVAGPSSVAASIEVSGPAAMAPSPMAESTPVVRPAAEAPSSIMAEITTVARPAAVAPSSAVAEPIEVSGPATAAPLCQKFLAELIAHDHDSAAALPSLGGEAGPTSTYEEEADDWDIVDHEDFPALPTYPKGAIDFTRLDFDHVELVPHAAWTGILSPFFYGEDVEAISNARRALLTRFLERQLTADRILTLSNPSLVELNFHIVGMGGSAFLNYGENSKARERGFTRIWKYDYENRCYLPRDKEWWE